MKYIIPLLAGLTLGFTVAKVGSHKIISTTSKGIENGSKATVKALDTVNKKITQ